MTASTSSHRPWAAPQRSWVMRMTWLDLAFLHWPVDASALRPHIPPGLEVETFDGTAWIGVVPFVMAGVRPRFVPPMPGLSRFPELNLRTYVKAGDKPGVWFFSLDVTNRPAVFFARTFFHLPYFKASMQVAAEGDGLRYASRRSDASGAGFEGRYAPVGPVERSSRGSLEAFLTERYCLYSADRRGRVFRGEVDHEPWPLQPGEVEIGRSDLHAGLGLQLPSQEPLVHFARRLDVVAWTLEAVS